MGSNPREAWLRRALALAALALLVAAVFWAFAAWAPGPPRSVTIAAGRREAPTPRAASATAPRSPAPAWKSGCGPRPARSRTSPGCRKCGGPLQIVAYITDRLSIRRILDHLGLSPPEEKPPPDLAEVVRVPLDDVGREIGITG